LEKKPYVEERTCTIDPTVDPDEYYPYHCNSHCDKSRLEKVLKYYIEEPTLVWPLHPSQADIADQEEFVELLVDYFSTRSFLIFYGSDTYDNTDIEELKKYSSSWIPRQVPTKEPLEVYFPWRIEDLIGELNAL
jgi:hypothetical protein